MPRSRTASPKDTSASLGFEAKLWLAANKPRNNMDAAEYKHVALGLIFLKYLSDKFEKHHDGTSSAGWKRRRHVVSSPSRQQVRTIA